MNRASTRALSAVIAGVVVAAAFLSPSAAGATPRRAHVERLGLDSFRPAVIPGEYVVGHERGARRLGIAQVQALGGRAIAAAGRRALLVRGATATEIRNAAGVSYVEPNYVRYLNQVVPNDPEFTNQWGAHNTGQQHRVSGASTTAAGVAGADMDLPEAWATTQGDDETIVAILDSGVDTTHPDLISNLWVNEAEANGVAGVDDDNNGYIDDVHGYDFAERDAGVFEPNPAYFGFDHGTHVAGTVAATANNGIGVAGVCPACKVMVLKVFEPHDTDSPPDGLSDTMLGDVAAGAEAIDYAIAMGADVINGSLGAPLAWSRTERAAIRRAQTAGITSVFAAGNENGDNDLVGIADFDGDDEIDSLSPSYPASYDLPGIISVAASNHNDQNAFSTACAAQLGSSAWPCTFTNWGNTSVDVSAPGVDVVSTVPGGYDAFDGTSMAAPHVAGLAGLLTSAHPTYSPMDIKNAIMNSTDTGGGLQTLRFAPGTAAQGMFTVTGGRVNANAALTASTANATPAQDGSIAGALWMKRSVSGTVAWPNDVNDVFKRRLVRGIDYRIRLDGPSGADLDLVVYKPRTTEIWQLEEGCVGGRGGCKLLFYAPEPDADETARMARCTARPPCIRPRRTGTYHIQVVAYLLSEGSYTLRVRRL